MVWAYCHSWEQHHRRLRSQVKTILREQTELEFPKDQSFSFDESTTGGVSSENNSRKKVTSLMAACHHSLEHNVSKILWRKVRNWNFCMILLI